MSDINKNNEDEEDEELSREILIQSLNLNMF